MTSFKSSYVYDLDPTSHSSTKDGARVLGVIVPLPKLYPTSIYLFSFMASFFLFVLLLYILLYIYIYIYICVCVCVYLHMYVFIYSYIYQNIIYNLYIL